MAPSRTVDRLRSFAGPFSSGPTVAVLGGGRTGCSLAAMLCEDGHEVRFLDSSADVVDRAKSRDVDAYLGDPVSRVDLGLIDPDSVDVAVVAELADKRSILCAQLLRTAFDCRTVVVFVTDPQNRNPIQAMEFQVLTTPEILSRELTSVLDGVGVEREGE